MPSKSPAQRKLMAIAAHTPGGYGGVPQAVGAEFHAADAGKSYGAGGHKGHQAGPRGGTVPSGAHARIAAALRR